MFLGRKGAKFPRQFLSSLYQSRNTYGKFIQMKPENNVLSTSYWPHLDGLRAFAVMTVLLFHFKAYGFDAGYLGVDIFFVISGFLVTRLIIKDINEHGKMRFKRFFARRIRRLFPTLAVVCFVTLIIAIIKLDIDKVAGFGKSVGAAIFSLSNIMFWSESGYFDSGSETKPLLHTWSLSVEEQFYLVWPATLALSYKFFHDNALKIASISAFIISVALILIWSFGTFDIRKDSTVFYWMPFRIYEFMLGAFCILLFQKTAKLGPKAHLVISGMGMILMLAAMTLPSFFLFQNGPILGAIAGLGAALVILTPGGAISQNLLAWQPIRWLGKISYSLYLVHWPLWVFAPEWLKDGGLDWVILTAASIFLTIPLHYLIETPLRHGKLASILKLRPSGDIKVFGAVATIVAISGIVISNQENLPFRKSAVIGNSEYKAGLAARFLPSCNLSKLESSNCDLTKPVQILFYGNSHEPDGYNIFHYAFKNSARVNLIKFGTTNGCKIQASHKAITSNVSARKCNTRVKNLNSLLRDQKISHVVYTANLPFKDNKKGNWLALEHMSLVSPKTKFIVLGGFINLKEQCTTLVNRHRDLNACIRPEYISSFPAKEQENGKLKSKLSYLYIDKIALMCKGKILSNCIYQHNGKLAIFDKNHLSLEYAELLGGMMEKQYEEELKAIGVY